MCPQTFSPKNFLCMILEAEEIYFHPNDEGFVTAGFRAESDEYVLLNRSLEPTEQDITLKVIVYGPRTSRLQTSSHLPLFGLEPALHVKTLHLELRFYGGELMSEQHFASVASVLRQWSHLKELSIDMCSFFVDDKQFFRQLEILCRFTQLQNVTVLQSGLIYSATTGFVDKQLRAVLTLVDEIKSLRNVDFWPPSFFKCYLKKEARKLLASLIFEKLTLRSLPLDLFAQDVSPYGWVNELTETMAHLKFPDTVTDDWKSIVSFNILYRFVHGVFITIFHRRSDISDFA